MSRDEDGVGEEALLVSQHQQQRTYGQLQHNVQEDVYNRLTHNNQTNVFITSDDAEERAFFFLASRSRILHFAKHAPVAGQPPHPRCMQETMNCLLKLLTTSKYRLLHFLYAIFSAVDRLLYLYLVIYPLLFLLNNTADESSCTGRLSCANLTLLLVVLVETFFDVVLSTTQVWTIERCYPWISLAIFGCYAGVFAGFGSEENHKEGFPNLAMDWVILIVRLGCFLFEAFIQYAIDMEIHRDLVGRADVRNNTFCCQWWESTFTLPRSMKRELREIGTMYVGSYPMWFFQEVLDPPPAKSNYVPSWHRIIFVIAAIPLFPFLVCLILLQLLLVAIGILFNELGKLCGRYRPSALSDSLLI